MIPLWYDYLRELWQLNESFNIWNQKLCTNFRQPWYISTMIKLYMTYFFTSHLNNWRFGAWKFAKHLLKLILYYCRLDVDILIIFCSITITSYVHNQNSECLFLFLIVKVISLNIDLWLLTLPHDEFHSWFIISEYDCNLKKQRIGLDMIRSQYCHFNRMN